MGQDEEGHSHVQDEGPSGQSLGTSHDERGEYTKGKKLRDAITMAMWKQYEIEMNSS